MNSTKIFILVVLSVGNLCNFQLPTHRLRTVHPVNYHVDQGFEEMVKLGLLHWSFRTEHQHDKRRYPYHLEMAPCCRPLRIKEIDEKQISKPLPTNQTLPEFPTIGSIALPSMEVFKPCLPLEELGVPQEAKVNSGDLVGVCTPRSHNQPPQNTSFSIRPKIQGENESKRDCKPAVLEPKPCWPREPRAVFSKHGGKRHHSQMVYVRPGVWRKITAVQMLPLSANRTNLEIHHSVPKKTASDPKKPRKELNSSQTGIRQSHVKLQQFLPPYWIVSYSPLAFDQQKDAFSNLPRYKTGARNTRNRLPSFMELVVFHLHSLLWMALVAVNLVGQLLICHVHFRHNGSRKDGSNCQSQSVTMLEGKVYDSLPGDRLLSDSCVIVNLSPTNSEESILDDWEIPFDENGEEM